MAATLSQQNRQTVKGLTGGQVQFDAFRGAQHAEQPDVVSRAFLFQATGHIGRLLGKLRPRPQADACPLQIAHSEITTT